MLAPKRAYVKLPALAVLKGDEGGAGGQGSHGRPPGRLRPCSGSEDRLEAYIDTGGRAVGACRRGDNSTSGRVNPLDQSVILEMRLEKSRGDKFDAAEEHELSVREFLRGELLKCPRRTLTKSTPPRPPPLRAGQVSY
jgi:hypothetical protein